MARVATRVHDTQVPKLIRRYLEAGVMDSGLVDASEEGTRASVAASARLVAPSFL